MAYEKEYRWEAWEPRLYHYTRMFDEALKRGQVYWPGESVKKFGLQIANIEPMRVAEGQRFEWGELIKKNQDGEAQRIEEDDSDSDFYGVVHRNATATYSVLSEQIMGMAPRLTLSVFRGGREGVVAMPVQNIFDYDSAEEVPVAEGGDVYVRIKPLGDEAPSWSDSNDYEEGNIVKHDGELYVCIDEHTGSSSVEPGEASDWEDTWKVLDYDLPIGGIETNSSNGECVEWTDATFDTKTYYPFKQEKYKDAHSNTTAVAGIELG